MRNGEGYGRSKPANGSGRERLRLGTQALIHLTQVLSSSCMSVRSREGRSLATADHEPFRSFSPQGPIDCEPVPRSRAAVPRAVPSLARRCHSGAVSTHRHRCGLVSRRRRRNRERISRRSGSWRPRPSSVPAERGARRRADAPHGRGGRFILASLEIEIGVTVPDHGTGYWAVLGTGRSTTKGRPEMYLRVRYVDAQGLEWREKVRVRSKEKVGVERAVAPRCPAQHRRVGHLPPRRAHVHGGS